MASQRDRGEGEKLAELGPLPGGHHKLTREQILDSQRERLLAAIAAEVAEVGYREVKIRAITARAEVSTRDFYEHFDGKEDAFLGAFEAVRDYLEGRILAAVAEFSDWHEQVIAALRAALEFFASEPDLARLCLVEPISATPTIAIRFREAVLACIPALARGRDLLPAGDELPESTEDSVLGGIITLASRKILDDEAQELPELLPDLVEFALGQYLGARRASQLAAELRVG